MATMYYILPTTIRRHNIHYAYMYTQYIITLSFSSLIATSSEAADIAEVELFFPVSSLSFLGGGGKASSPKSRVTA